MITPNMFLGTACYVREQRREIQAKHNRKMLSVSLYMEFFGRQSGILFVDLLYTMYVDIKHF